MVFEFGKININLIGLEYMILDSFFLAWFASMIVTILSSIVSF